KLILRDMAPYPVEVSTDTVERTIVFPAGSEVNSRKAFSFRHQKDFQALVSYPVDQNLPFSELSRVSVTGLSKAAGQYSPEDLGQPLPKVRLSLVMTESGLVSLAKAEAAFNVTNKETESTSTATETTEMTTTTTTSSADATPSSPFKIVKVALDTHVEPLGVPAMSPTAKTTARTRFAEMDKDDRLRRERSEAINNFEKLLFFVIDTMEEAPYTTYITPEALEALVAEAHTHTEWLDEEKETATTAVFTEKLAIFKKKVDEVQFRKEEHEHRPVMIEKLESAVDAAKTLLTSYFAKYSPEELESVRKELDHVKNQVEQTATWLQDMVTKQESVALTETPVLLSKDLKSHLNLVQIATKKLTSRKVRKPVTATSTADEQEQTSSSSGDAEQDSSAKHEEL
ncbi:lumenal Hsp70 protein, partial [Dispira parvispora]